MTKVKFSGGQSDTNYHDWNGAKGKTILGPRISLVKLSINPPSSGYRLIWYFPSSAWWHVDVVFDRRGAEGRNAE